VWPKSASPSALPGDRHGYDQFETKPKLPSRLWPSPTTWLQQRNARPRPSSQVPPSPRSRVFFCFAALSCRNRRLSIIARKPGDPFTPCYDAAPGVTLQAKMLRPPTCPLSASDTNSRLPRFPACALDYYSTFSRADPRRHACDLSSSHHDWRLGPPTPSQVRSMSDLVHYSNCTNRAMLWGYVPLSVGTFRHSIIWKPGKFLTIVWT